MSRNVSRSAARLSRLLVCAFLAAGAFPGKSWGQVAINEFLAKNGLSGTDEDGDNEDWVELLNLGASEVDLAGWTLTDDPELPRKWVFPAIKIPARGYLRIWLSGKDRFVPPPDVISGDPLKFAFLPTIVAAAEEWQYIIGNPAVQGPPAGWNLLSFDAGAAGFSTGRTGFGYSDDDDYTILPAGTTTVFIRKIFRVNDPASLANLVLQVNFDDGFVAYLNGARAAAAYAPSGDPNFQSLATGSHEAGTPLRYDLTPYKDRLLPGDNVLALAGLNNSSGSTDLSLLPELGTIPLVLHANFHLDDTGEYLGLIDPSGIPADQLFFPTQTEDHSYGRWPDGTGPWFYLLTPTPEASNETLRFEEPISSEVAFDPPSGKFSAAVDVNISVSPAGIAEVRYTKDGSAPIPESPLWTGPMHVQTNTVFRAAGFIGGERSTRIISKSYFIGGSLALPIFSISMDPADYLKVHTDSWASGRGSERAGYLEIFEGDGTPGPATGFGLRLHGGAGRDGTIDTKKAYKCYFRSSYGDGRLIYPLIQDTQVISFDKLVLRAGFNDAFRTNGGAAYIRDQVIRDLHGDMGAIISNGSWYNLYVNMRYRGVYNVCEKMDDEFLESYTGSRNWDVMKTGNEVQSGDNAEWERLHSFMLQNDLSQEARYREAETLIDVENFTSYMIINTWAQNHDWPHNNWYAARKKVPEGRWIFMCWDAEFGLGLYPGGYTTDSFEFALNQGGYLRDIFQSMLASPIYQAYFMEQVDRYLFFQLKPKNVLARIDALQKVIAPDMTEEAALTGNTYSQWLANVSVLRTFANGRGTPYRTFLQNSARCKFPVPPRVFACDQKQVVNAGGVVVRLRGTRFRNDIKFSFNGIDAAAAKIISGALESIMDVTLPLDMSLNGFPVIGALDPKSGQSSEARDLLEVLPPVPEPLSVDPGSGDTRGGQKVRITGTALLDGATVSFGGVPSTSVVLIPGTPPALEVVTPAGAGEVDVLVVNHLQGADLPARTVLRFLYRPPGFLRGDSNGDGLADISDPILVLFYLFEGTGSVPCLDALDFDDSGILDLSDVIRSLAFLFQGGGDPPPPFPTCGEDPTSDGLACEGTVYCR